ncbi:hypothetical protein TNCV_3693611 [Trichonephila clavipes]|nr:hypothetical protein TNCV_3693611 [Trichonephila clavipes]
MPERILDQVCVFHHIVNFQPTVMEKGQISEWPLSGVYYSDIGNIERGFTSKSPLPIQPKGAGVYYSMARSHSDPHSKTWKRSKESSQLSTDSTHELPL